MNVFLGLKIKPEQFLFRALKSPDFIGAFFMIVSYLLSVIPSLASHSKYFFTKNAA
jgi:hypothetical protein